MKAVLEAEPKKLKELAEMTAEYMWKLAKQVGNNAKGVQELKRLFRIYTHMRFEDGSVGKVIQVREKCSNARPRAPHASPGSARAPARRRWRPRTSATAR